MMLIQNVGNKIVSIGSTVLMPGKQMKASDELANSASIKALVKRKQLKVVKPAVKAAALAQTEAASAKDATIASAVAAAKKRTKKAAETAEASAETAQEG